MLNQQNQVSPGISQAGFGLVEVLVAMAIGMIGMLAIMQSFAVNERYKENTVGSSSAQTNGSIALFTIERDVRMAGYGITSSAALECNTIRYHYNERYTSPPGGGVGAPLPSLAMAPVVITQGAGLTPADSIKTMSSSSTYRFAPASLTQVMATASDAMRVDDVTGFTVGDLVVATQGTTCAMMQLTQIQAAGLMLEHTPGSSALFNPNGGNSLPAFTSGAQIFNLGQPQIRTYEVSNQNLTVTEWMLSLTAGAAAANVIVDEIVDLQAEYGVDDGSNGGIANDGILDGYTTVTPGTSAGWGQVLAIRLAILARAGYERPADGTTCTATPASNPPRWAGGDLNVPGGLPSCYRYSVFETVVPLRNMIWRDV